MMRIAFSLLLAPHLFHGTLANDGRITPDTQALLKQIEEMAERSAERDEFVKQMARKVRKLQAETAQNYAVPLDTIWLILCGALVMIMQSGFAMVCAGCCRVKNVQHILLKNLTDVCVGTMGWFVLGYSFAYRGVDNDDDGFLDNGFIGEQGIGGFGMSHGVDGKYTPTMAGDYAMYVHWFFQWAFCTAGATIVSGSVAERVHFEGYAVYSLVMTSFIYPVLVAWTWGYGWIAGEVNSVGYIDFAGSGVVHMTGGIGALVGACFAGARKDRWEKESEFVPHNLPLIVLGTFILWFGWYGFNCGSTLSMHDDITAYKASLVAMNTTISAATGGITVLMIQYALTRKYDLGALCNGILGGLVSITAGCSNVNVGSALMIGILGGCVYSAASATIKKLKIDDPVDAFSVHGACGAWGVLAAALFDWGEGFKYANGWSGFTCVTGDDGCDPDGWAKTLAANIVEIIMVILWSGGLSCIVFGSLRSIGWLRESDEAQEIGADEAKHSQAQAYVMDRVNTNSSRGSRSSQGSKERPAVTATA